MKQQTTFKLLTFFGLLFFSHWAQAQCSSANYDVENCIEFTQGLSGDYSSSDPFSANYNLADAGNTFYIHSNVGNPWFNTTNQDAMNLAFGAGNWTETFFETLNPALIFSPTTRFVFLEGSDTNASELNTFLTANLPTIENWVAAGGSLLLNAAPNEGGNINFGFGGSTLIYSYPTSTSDDVTVVDTNHPAFLGPHLPTSATMSGGNYAHSYVTGSGFTDILLNDANGAITPLREKDWGSGTVIMGGMTTTNYHLPQPAASNWRANLLVYLEEMATTSCPGDINVDNDPGQCGAVVTYVVNPGGISTIQTAGLPSGSLFPVGTTTNTFDGIDSSGNAFTCSFDVTVNDTEAPIITCPADITVSNDAGLCGAVVTFADPGATDNCLTDGLLTFLYTGTVQTFTVPAGITEIHAQVYGAQGGANWVNNVNYGGLVEANIPVSPGQTLYLYVGEQPSDIIGGWNGGGNGEALGAGGGGASDIRIGGTALTDRIIVGGAGGGAGFWSGEHIVGGPGGDLIGGAGYRSNLGNPGGDPGTQVGSGNGTCSFFNNPIVAGGLGYGGAPNNCGCEGYGGGAGYYGGAGSGNCRGGGGGSSYTAPSLLNVIHSQGVRQGNGEIIISFGMTPVVNQTAGLPSGSEFPVGTTTNIFEVTDTSGNTSTCSFDVTVEDTEAPVANCVAPFTLQLDASGNATINASDLDNGSTDNCAIASVDFSETLTAFATANEGQNLTITLPGGAVVEAVDFASYGTPNGSNGNYTIGSCHAANSQAIVESYALGNNSFTIPADNAIFGDPCGGTVKRLYVTVSYGTSETTIDFDCSNVGPNPITLTVTDVNGNSSTCTTIVTVEDNVAPIANCAAPFTIQLDANGNASITVADIENGSTDACGIASTTIDIDTFDCSNVGDNTVTLTVTDVNGNVSTCTTIVTVEDNVAPIANCAAPFTIQLDANGNASIAVADIENGSTDACGIASTTIDIDTFDCSNVGDNTVTLTVTDVNGNISTCTTIVTVEDNVAPIANCAAPFTIQLDADGNASITVADIENGSTDACGIASTTIDITDFDCSNVGDNTVTLTVTDVNGNVSTCTTIVTVEDNVAPIANCAAPFTVQLDADGNASITVADIENGSTDACGIASTTIDIDTFDCSNVGDNTVTLTVTDVNGNVSTCTTIVTVEDSLAPIIACPADITVNTDPTDCFATVNFPAAIALDNCGVASVVQTAGLPSGSEFPVGVNTIEFTATDVNGNTSVCSFNITVIDNQMPVAVCQDLTIQLDEFGNASITAAHLDGGSTDNCGVATTTIDMDTFDCSNVGPNNVTLTVTDVNGNVSTCIAVVTVEDVTAPVVACQNITIQLDASGTVTITGNDIDNGSTDACGIASYDLDMATFDCSNVGENTVVLTVTDVNGNTATCTATVTVEDVTAPVLVCQDFTLELGADGTAILLPGDVIASNVDACGIFTTAVDITEFDCSDIGTPVIVQVFTQDNNGNLATCNATVTVIDALAPVITCPADQTVDPGAGNLFYILPDYFATGEATATDNCTDPVTIFTQNPAPGTALSDGVHTITLTAEDEYGNVSECTFELTVESILGANDPSVSLGSVQLYPNPAKDVVTFGNPQLMALQQATIYDLTGRLVQTINLEGMGATKTINVQHLSAATYIVMIKGKTGQITKRLIKE